MNFDKYQRLGNLVTGKIKAGVVHMRTIRVQTDGMQPLFLATYQRAVSLIQSVVMGVTLSDVQILNLRSIHDLSNQSKEIIGNVSFKLLKCLEDFQHMIAGYLK